MTLRAMVSKRRRFWPALLAVPFMFMACGGGTKSSTTTTPPPTSNCAAQPSGLVSWWKGESNATDAKGLYDGTASGNVTYTASEVGSGFVFDGATSYITMGAVTGTQLDVGTSDFTIEFWLKTNSDLDTGGVGQFVAGDGGNGIAQGFRVVYRPTDAHQLRFRIADATSAQTVDTAAVNDGAWHHFAFVRMGTSMLAYEDGAQVGTATTATTLDLSSASGFVLGSRGLDSFYEGGLDEVSFYSRALTATEISAIFAAGSDGKCS